jgi:hypothetical protein
MMENSGDERIDPTSPMAWPRPPPMKQAKGKRHNPNKEILEDPN